MPDWLIAYLGSIQAGIVRYQSGPPRDQSKRMSDMRNGIHRPQRRRPPGVQNSAAQQRKNGPGNAHRNYERYLPLARDATWNGEIIEAENCYQHAEHYFRVTRER